MPVQKLQVPSSKLQRNIKFQTLILELGDRSFPGAWSLELEASLEFGVWDLELRLRSRREQFA
jgi:hypothetical protein